MSATTAIPDYYAALEINPRASSEIVHAAYRVLAAAHAQDADDAKLRLITEAKGVLYDEYSRAEYDRKRTNKTGVCVGNYRLIKEIAEGGFGRTYKGEHLLTKGAVCIKQCCKISPEDDQVLIEEALAMWDLRHFSIPSVKDIIRGDDGGLYLIMSWMEGMHIEKIVETIGAIPVEHVSWIVERILNPLMYIHERLIIHGDIKPQNVLVMHKEHMAGIVDFGLSMINPTAKDQAKGYTQYFAPPEQIARKPLLPQSDFYSLGVLIIYMLCGGNTRDVSNLNIPSSTPKPFKDFVYSLVRRDVMARPDWNKGQFYRDYQQMRQDVFGRSHTNFEPIPGLA